MAGNVPPPVIPSVLSSQQPISPEPKKKLPADLQKFSKTKWFKSLSVDKNGQLVEKNFIAAFFDRKLTENYKNKFDTAVKNFIQEKVNESLAGKPHTAEQLPPDIFKAVLKIGVRAGLLQKKEIVEAQNVEPFISRLGLANILKLAGKSEPLAEKNDVSPIAAASPPLARSAEKISDAVQPVLEDIPPPPPPPSEDASTVEVEKEEEPPSLPQKPEKVESDAASLAVPKRVKDEDEAFDRLGEIGSFKIIEGREFQVLFLAKDPNKTAEILKKLQSHLDTSPNSWLTFGDEEGRLGLTEKGSKILLGFLQKDKSNEAGMNEDEDAFATIMKVLKKNNAVSEAISSEPVTPQTVAKTYTWDTVLEDFRNVRSGELIATEVELNDREDFHNPASKWTTPPPILGRSSFVSDEMVNHLMRKKKDDALGKKYENGDEITNMEGAMHTFLTPVCKAHLLGDRHWYGESGNAEGAPFKKQLRPFIMSAAIHPDFERRFNPVVMSLVRLKPEGFKKGNDAPPMPVQISAVDKVNQAKRDAYDAQLRNVMVHNLVTEGLPELREVETNGKKELVPVDGASKPYPFFKNMDEAIAHIENLIKEGKDLTGCMKNQFVKHGSDFISLEVLFNIYIEQINNEFRALNLAAPQGFVYTIDPPNIFATQIGAKVLNRMQILAFKHLSQTKKELLSNLKAVGYNGYSDPNAVELMKVGLSKDAPNVKVVDKGDLYTKDKRERFDKYNPAVLGPGSEKYALVLHNNSDGFGNNIRNEHLLSLDGVIGTYSDASKVLELNRPDLVDFPVDKAPKDT